MIFHICTIRLISKIIIIAIFFERSCTVKLIMYCLISARRGRRQKRKGIRGGEGGRERERDIEGGEEREKEMNVNV